MQRARRNDDAIAIGINPISGHRDDTEQRDSCFRLTFGALDRAPRTKAQRTDAERTGIQFIRVAHGASDHDSAPPIGRRRLGKIATEHGATQAFARVDQEHPAIARLLDDLRERRVVFKDLERRGLAVETNPLAKRKQSRPHQLHDPGQDIRLVPIAQVGRCDCSH